MAKSRTVNDYKSRDELRLALQTFVDETGSNDWELKNYDAATSEPNPNSIEDEVDRLMVLQSYDLLDTGLEMEFEQMTQEAKEYFGTPIAVVSIVDLGRQWFKSIKGLDVEMTPRCMAFCSHVVKRKERYGCLIVNNALEDPRFQHNPLVTGGPKIRFYAGAPLITPEGIKIGSFCIIDSVPHPQGLTKEEQQRLQMFATEAVFHIIVRKKD